MSAPRGGVFERPLVQAAVAVLLVFGLLAAFLLFSHRSAETITTTASRNEVRVLATQIEGALRRIEMSIGFMRDKYIRIGLHENAGTPAWEASLVQLQLELQHLARGFPEAVAILVTDAQGKILASTLDTPPQWDIGDREYFRHAREHRQDALAFSEPVIYKAGPREGRGGLRSDPQPGGRFRRRGRGRARPAAPAGPAARGGRRSPGHGQHPAQRRRPPGAALAGPRRQPGRRHHQHRAFPGHPPRRDVRQRALRRHRGRSRAQLRLPGAARLSLLRGDRPRDLRAVRALAADGDRRHRHRLGHPGPAAGDAGRPAPQPPPARAQQAQLRRPHRQPPRRPAPGGPTPRC
jgi:hypothetical protein